jgi:dTDP-4-dehydrorhamnose 3,5-epimerase
VQRVLRSPARNAAGRALRLCDDTDVFCQLSQRYAPEAGQGLRWTDPLFVISWPLSVAVISEKDREFPCFDPESFDG